MKRIYLFFSQLLIAGVIISSCTDDKYDFLQGTWERVNVEDINDPYRYEWVFQDGELTMYRISKEDPSDVSIRNSGYYSLEVNPLGTGLVLSNTSNSTWNDKWDVIKLDNEQLIINLEITGGIILREFVKKP